MYWRMSLSNRNTWREYITLILEHASESLRDELGTLGFDVIQDENSANHFFVHET